MTRASTFVLLVVGPVLVTFASCADDEPNIPPAKLVDASLDVTARDQSAAEATTNDVSVSDANVGDANVVTDAGADVVDAGNDGTVNEAGADAADAADASDAGDAGKWVYVRIDDCPGNDRIAYTTTSDAPVEANCDVGSAGTVAVCWDQTTYTNNLVPSSAPGCTYKSVNSATCTGGTHPGFMYVCSP